MNQDKLAEVAKLAERAAVTVAGLKNLKEQWHIQRHRLARSFEHLLFTKTIPYFGDPKNTEAGVSSSVLTGKVQGDIEPITPHLAGLTIRFSATPYYKILAEVTVPHPDGKQRELEEMKYALNADAEEMVLEQAQRALEEVIKFWTA
jgi:hypothetical protein